MDTGTGTDRWGLLPGVISAIVVLSVYVVSFDFPGHYGGLYLDMATALLDHGPGYVRSIDGYTVDGVPFAYPPVGLVLLAGGLWLQVDVATLYWVLPSVFYLLSVPALYKLVTEITGSTRVATLASVLILTSPEVYRPLVVATGVTRGPGFVFSLVGILIGIRLFEAGNPRQIVLGGVLFGLTVMSHPVYATFYSISYLLLWAVYSRSIRGFALGSGVVGVGLVVALPWLGTVVSNHGVEIFLRTSRVRGGIGPDLVGFAISYFYNPNVPVIALSQGVGILGLMWLAVRRRLFLVLWFLSIGVLVGNPRFLHVITGISAAWFIVNGLVPSLERHADLTEWLRRLPLQSGERVDRLVPVLVVTLVATYSVLGGVGFLVAENNVEKISNDDRTAMEWVGENTPVGATVLVVGDGAEWLPWFTNRTVLVTPMGSEWKGPSAFRRQSELRSQLLQCTGVACVESVTEQLTTTPDYVYVQEDHRSVAESLQNSSKYSVVHRRGGIFVFEVHAE
ncbi:ArnT family glycosyltransferase [Halobaculum sp. MBLA0147]|uniref:ArnT family glycosyltransferase n=1 Tax=Halobaculum sp. MBLA0147 TaxID=3079934 RepID=UPI0035255C6F